MYCVSMFVYITTNLVCSVEDDQSVCVGQFLAYLNSTSVYLLCDVVCEPIACLVWFTSPQSFTASPVEYSCFLSV